MWKSKNAGAAAIIVGGSIALSRVIGLVRDLTISHLAGATADTDVYYVAFLIPDLINYLLAGAYFSITLIPILSRYSSSEEKDECWQVFSPIFNLLSALIFAIVVVMFAACPALIHVIAPGFSPSQMREAVRLTRIILPAQCFFIAGSLFMAVQYTYRYFLIPALAPVIYNVSIILGGIFLYDTLGIAGFSWGVLAGAFLGNFCCQLFGAKRSGLKMTFSFWHPEVKTFVALAIPIMLGQSIVVLDEQFTRIFGSLSPDGTVSWLNYARRVMMVPVGMVAQAAGVASYPFLASLIHEGKLERFYTQLSSALKGTLFVIIPFSAWIGSISYPLVMLLFQHGRFTGKDTVATAGILLFYLVGVFAWGIQQVLGRGFYARRKAIPPVIIGTAATVLLIPLYYFLSRVLNGKGTALASSSAIILYTVSLMVYWRHRWGGDAFRGVGRQFVKVCSIALPVAVISYYLSGLVVHVSALTGKKEAVLSVLLTTVVFWGVFMGFSVVLRIPESILFLRYLPFLKKIIPVSRTVGEK
jgi:putative peptidoglycan lipid II flippase